MTDMCKSGLHEMTPDNVIVQKSTGRKACRQCKLVYKRWRTATKPRCLSGHSYANPQNWYLTPKGQKRCAVCKRKKADARARAAIRVIAVAAAEEREAAAAAAAVREAAAKAAVVTPRVRQTTPGGGRYGDETDARYRLARMVRAGRT